MLFALNCGTFREFIAKERVLDPKFNPTDPRHLSLLSQLFGYEDADAVAQLAPRGAKNLLRSAVAEGLKAHDP